MAITALEPTTSGPASRIILNELIAEVNKHSAAVGAPIVALSEQMVWDRDGVLYSSTALSFYVPRNLYASLGSNVLPSASYGTASAALATHVQLLVEDNDLAVVYLDLDDAVNPQKIANWPTLPSKEKPDKIVILALIRNYRVVWSVAPVIETTDMTADRVDFRYPIVVEKDHVLFPGFYHRNRGAGITQNYEPADGARYWKFDRITSSGTGMGRYVFDRSAAAAGQVPIKLLTTSTQPVLTTDHWFVEIGSSLARGLSTKHEVVGNVAGGTAPNLFSCGNDPDSAYLYSPTDTSIVNVTDANLLALGFRRGVTGPSAFYGEYLPECTPAAGYFFARVYVQTAVDNDWGVPVLYLRGKSGALGAAASLVLEERISARAAIFSAFTRYSYSERPTHFYIGQFTAGASRVFCGAQTNVGQSERGWILRDDRPDVHRPDILYPQRHFAIVDRPVAFHPSAIVAERDDRDGYALNLTAATTYGVPLISSHRSSFVLDYNRHPHSSTFDLLAAGRDGTSSMRATRSVEVVRIGPPVAPVTRKILAFGDSITYRGLADLIDKKAAAMGITLNWQGTLKVAQNNTGLAISTPIDLYTEGRSGWAISDFIYKKTAQPPVAVGGEAAYLARSPEGTYGSTRHNYNPWIRAATGGDNPAQIFNGHIFDAGFGLGRLGLDAPDIALIGLGTNDINEGMDPADVLATITVGLPLMVASIRAAAPAAPIGIWLPAAPRSGQADTTWRRYYVPVLRWMLKYVTELGDPGVDLLPTWAHMSPEASWRQEAREIAGGQTFGWLDDYLHPSNPNRNAMGEVIAAWIAHQCWTPAELGTSLLAWWNADRSDLITLSGSEVTSWKDTVAGYDVAQAVAASRPQWSATGFNGAPGVAFDGTDDYLRMGSNPVPSNNVEFWGVLSQDSPHLPATSRYWLGSGGTSGVNSIRHYRTTVSNIARVRSLVGNGASNPSATVDNVAFIGRHVVRARVADDAIAVSANGGALASAAVVPSIGSANLTVGAETAGTPAGYWQGQIRDIIVTKPLSAYQAERLNRYLQYRRRA